MFRNNLLSTFLRSASIFGKTPSFFHTSPMSDLMYRAIRSDRKMDLLNQVINNPKEKIWFLAQYGPVDRFTTSIDVIGYDPDKCNGDGLTAIIIAVWFGNKDMWNALLEKGASAHKTIPLINVDALYVAHAIGRVDFLEDYKKFKDEQADGAKTKEFILVDSDKKGPGVLVEETEKPTSQVSIKQ